MAGMAVRMKDPASGQEYSFSPARDIAYFYPQIVETACKGLCTHSWEPWYATYLRERNVTEEQLMNTAVAFMKFCSNGTEPKYANRQDGMYTALTDSGFFECPEAAQLVVLAKIGQLCAGAFWDGIRSASRMDEVPSGLKDLAKAAEQLSTFIASHWSPDGKATQRKTPARPAPQSGLITLLKKLTGKRKEPDPRQNADPS